MNRAKTPAGSLHPNNKANKGTDSQHNPTPNDPGAVERNVHTSPNKRNHPQDTKTPVIVPQAGDDYSQQQDRPQERDVAEVLQMKKNKIECQDSRSEEHTSEL